jgi:DNA-binding NarL/FixJ family response regulator
VIAIDDAQWLDLASARALRFALRRLDAAPVGVIATVRLGAEAPDPLGLVPALPPGCVETAELGPLGPAAIRRVLAGTVAAISRPTLRRIHEVSGGNPLYAIELARGLLTDDVDDAQTGELHLPDSLQAAIARRLENVDPELAPLLETAAALGRTSVAELRRTVPGSDADALIATAAEHGLLVVDESLAVRFTHPTIGSAVYERMSPLARRSLHARLADLAAEPDVRARHLALSTGEPDAAVAELLEEAANRAASRSAFDVAADFAAHSVRLTPPGDPEAERRRAITEMENRAVAGEVSRALALADRLVAASPPGPGRAEVLLKRAYFEDDDWETSEGHLLRALEESRADEVLHGRVLEQLGWLSSMFRGDLRSGLERTREAARIADRTGDRHLRLITTTYLAFLEGLAGQPRATELAEAVALAEDGGWPFEWEDPRVLQAELLLWSGELRPARALLAAVQEAIVRTGSEVNHPYCLFDLALLECAAGDAALAVDLAREGIEAARDTADSWGETLLLYPLALANAWLGRAGPARAAAERRGDEAAWRGERPGIVRAHSVLGLLALSEGDSRTAAQVLVEGAELLEATGFANPGAFPILPDAIEALAGSDDLTHAEMLLERLELQAASGHSAWAAAAADRSRGALLLARGETEAAAEALEAAAAAFDGMGFGPDGARAVLLRGKALLRRGNRTQAADVLADARGRLAGMGAALWEARAAEALERASPGRASGGLTDSESRIAALVAEGMKNREIGQALFMSVATVEAHLTRIYRKLGIRSRSELARRVADGSVPVSGAEGS